MSRRFIYDEVLRKMVEITNRPSANRKRNATEIRNIGFPDCPPGKEQEWRDHYAGKGIDVRFDPANGDAIFATRRDQLKAVKTIKGLHVQNEVSG